MLRFLLDLLGLLFRFESQWLARLVRPESLRAIRLAGFSVAIGLLEDALIAEYFSLQILLDIFHAPLVVHLGNY